MEPGNSMYARWRDCNPFKTRFTFASLRRSGLKSLLIAIQVSLILASAPLHSNAKTFVIANGDVPGLIAAILEASDNKQDDVIELAPGGDYPLMTEYSGPVGLPFIKPDLVGIGSEAVGHRLTIIGNGATLRRHRSAIHDFVLINAGVFRSNAPCRLTGLTLLNGKSPILPGGGIHANGYLILENCAIEGCEGTSGGGVSSEVDVEMTNCAILNNAASASGGALFARGRARLTNCTLAGNSAITLGSAINNYEGKVFLTHCTLSGGEIYTSGATHFNNCILNQVRFLASPVLIPGVFISEGHNVFSNLPGGIQKQPNDLTLVPLGLDPLGPRFNGGPTKTIALLATSPAIDRGTSEGILTDQRGQARPFDNASLPNVGDSDGSDIGAYEATDPIQSFPLVVNTLADHDDGIAGMADCTLREAIARANLYPGAEIRFADALTGIIELDRSLGTLSLTGTQKILGPGARRLAVSGGGYVRVLNANGVDIQISRLTLRDGKQGSGNPGDSFFGGGIYNRGHLTLIDVALTHHVVLGENGRSEGGAGGSALGAGIYNEGLLEIARCTFSECVAAGGSGGDSVAEIGFGGTAGAGNGAALYNASVGVVTIENSTFANNSAAGGGGGQARFGGRGGDGRGGAIYNLGNMSVSHISISQNSGQGGAGGKGIGPVNDGSAGAGTGGIWNQGELTLTSALCAKNQSAGDPAAVDLDGTFTSAGFNLLGVVRSQFVPRLAPTDRFGTSASPLDPQLGLLRDNGGDTDTLAPQPGSPAIDAGKSTSRTTDQRGLARPLDVPLVPNAAGSDGSDIGAVETDIVQPGTHFEVNTLDDHDDGSPSFADCTLREALQTGNRLTEPVFITFRSGLRGVIALNSALGSLQVSNSITVSGPGARYLTIDGHGDTRVLAVSAGTSVISDVSIENGSAPLTGATRQWRGGAILNEATLTVTNCRFRGNRANPDRFPSFTIRSGVGAGGAIANAPGANLRIVRCSFSDNAAQGAEGRVFGRVPQAGGSALGGAILNDTNATGIIENSTFAYNAAIGGDGAANPISAVQGGDAHGGAIANFGRLTLTSITVATNRCHGGLGGDNDITQGAPGIGAGGGISTLAGAVSSVVRNSIIAGNTSPDSVAPEVEGVFVSEGFNLIGDATGSTGLGTAAGDRVGTTAAPINPGLRAFGNGGGATDSFALLENSPARDRGKSFGLLVDQRGLTRPFDAPDRTNAAGGDGSDIGAIEMRPAYVGPLVIASITSWGNGWRLWVQGKPETTYRLESVSTLDPAQAFVPQLPTAVSDGLGLAEFLDFNVQDSRFYRAVEVP